MIDLQSKYDKFVELHHREGAVVVPNAWNAGSAKILAMLGYEALATTSAGYAAQVGKRDSCAGLSRAEIIANAAEIVAACDLPVSGDLEDGFGAAPISCAVTVQEASLAGLVGGAIEDATGDADKPIYEFDHAVERIAAAAEAARDIPFLLTARSENFITGNPDLADTIKRLQAFSQAGADVLYAPGLPSLEAIETVCREVDKPVNVVMGLSGPTWTVDQLSAAGVKRISVGGSFARAALGALIRAAWEVRSEGTFTYAKDAIEDTDLSRFMDAVVDADRD